MLSTTYNRHNMPTVSEQCFTSLPTQYRLYGRHMPTSTLTTDYS